MIWFRNRQEAFKQGRMHIGHVMLHGNICEVVSALPNEPIFKFLNRTIKFKWRGDQKGLSGHVVSVGYDLSGSCWPVVLLDIDEKCPSKLSVHLTDANLEWIKLADPFGGEDEIVMDGDGMKLLSLLDRL